MMVICILLCICTHTKLQRTSTPRKNNVPQFCHCPMKSQMKIDTKNRSGRQNDYQHQHFLLLQLIWLVFFIRVLVDSSREIMMTNHFFFGVHWALKELRITVGNSIRLSTDSVLGTCLIAIFSRRRQTVLFYFHLITTRKNYANSWRLRSGDSDVGTGE